MNRSFALQLERVLDCVRPLAEPAFQQRLECVVGAFGGTLKARKPLLVCGNGGSAADAQHIAGELVGKFMKERAALNVRALSTDSSIITAWANDVGYETVFSRQVEAYGQPGGALWAISTSGNSDNVLRAAEAARGLDMRVVGLTGEAGGRLAALCDVLIDVPSRDTPRIQEMHVMIYHYICERLEALFA